MPSIDYSPELRDKADYPQVRPDQGTTRVRWYRGKAPAEKFEPRELGTVEHDGVTWHVVQLLSFMRPTWVNLAVYARGSAPRKANYRFGVNVQERRVAKCWDSDVMAKHRPALLEASIALALEKGQVGLDSRNPNADLL